MCNPVIEKYGAKPANIQWVVVRGDTATLRVDFLEDDEVTHVDTTGWRYKATSYDPAGEMLDNIKTISHPGYVIIQASSDVTKNWGNTYSTIVAELPFDLQVSIPDGEVCCDTWTPVIGTICVLGDVSPGGSL